MRTNNAHMNLSALMGSSYGKRIPVDQFPGVHRAYIVDTDNTNNGLPPGQARFRIPAIDNNIVWGPAPYPPAYGSIDVDNNGIPLNGTQCIVAFEGNMTTAPLIISLIKAP